MGLELPKTMVISEITLEQEPDSCLSPESEYQKLTIQVENAGGGNFIRIKTDAWAIDDTETAFFTDLFKMLTSKENDLWEKEE